MERASDVRAAGLFRRPAGRPDGAARKARFRFRAALAPLVLAAYTVFAAMGAALALAPAVLARGPLGRRRTPRGTALDLSAPPPGRLDVPAPPPATGAEEREALGG